MFEVSYELVITPVMMAAGEIGVRKTKEDGVVVETYMPFNYNTCSFVWDGNDIMPGKPVSPILKKEKKPLADMLSI